MKLNLCVTASDWEDEWSEDEAESYSVPSAETQEW